MAGRIAQYPKFTRLTGMDVGIATRVYPLGTVELITVPYARERMYHLRVEGKLVKILGRGVGRRYAKARREMHEFIEAAQAAAAEKE